MPATKNGQAIKTEVIRIITVNIGKKTADMYREFYDAHSPDVAIASAEELLADFVGRTKANEQIQGLRAKFKLAKARAV